MNTPVFSLHPASIFIREDCFISSHCLSEQVSSTFFLLREPYLHPHCPPAYKQGQPPGKSWISVRHKLLLSATQHQLCSVLHSISSVGLQSPEGWFPPFPVGNAHYLSISQKSVKEYNSNSWQVVFSYFPWKKGCVADFVCIFLLPLQTCQKTTKQ